MLRVIITALIAVNLSTAGFSPASPPPPTVCVSDPGNELNPQILNKIMKASVDYTGWTHPIPTVGQAYQKFRDRDICIHRVIKGGTPAWDILYDGQELCLVDPI